MLLHRAIGMVLTFLDRQRFKENVKRSHKDPNITAESKLNLGSLFTELSGRGNDHL